VFGSKAWSQDEEVAVGSCQGDYSFPPHTLSRAVHPTGGAVFRPQIPKSIQCRRRRDAVVVSACERAEIRVRAGAPSSRPRPASPGDRPARIGRRAEGQSQLLRYPERTLAPASSAPADPGSRRARCRRNNPLKLRRPEPVNTRRLPAEAASRAFRWPVVSPARPRTPPTSSSRDWRGAPKGWPGSITGTRSPRVRSVAACTIRLRSPRTPGSCARLGRVAESLSASRRAGARRRGRGGCASPPRRRPRRVTGGR
jgi:hypothetical protein